MPPKKAAKATEAETVSEKQDDNRPLAFVIMPFTKAVSPFRGSKAKYKDRSEAELTKLWLLLEKFLGVEGYKARRADAVGDILKEIVEDIHAANIIVAVLTGLNPNVFYELGIAHGFRKQTLLLTEDRNELPFDLKGYNCIEYQFGGTDQSKALGRKVKQGIKKIREREGATFGPVQAHLEISEYAVSVFDRKRAAKRLDSLSDELIDLYWVSTQALCYLIKESTLEFSAINDEVTINIKELKKSIETGVFKRIREVFDFSLYTSPCLDLFLSEHYVPDGVVEAHQIRSVRWVASTLRRSMASCQSGYLENLFQIYFAVSHLLPDILAIEDKTKEQNSKEALRLKCKGDHPELIEKPIEMKLVWNKSFEINILKDEDKKVKFIKLLQIFGKVD